MEQDLSVHLPPPADKEGKCLVGDLLMIQNQSEKGTAFLFSYHRSLVHVLFPSKVMDYWYISYLGSLPTTLCTCQKTRGPFRRKADAFISKLEHSDPSLLLMLQQCFLEGNNYCRIQPCNLWPVGLSFQEFFLTQREAKRQWEWLSICYWLPHWLSL